MSKIFDNNFIVRMLYKNVYWFCCSRYYILLSIYCFLYLYVHDAFCHRVFIRIWMKEGRQDERLPRAPQTLAPPLAVI